jgi:hypothetical protein
MLYQAAEKLNSDPIRHAEPWTDEDQARFSISIKSVNYETLNQVQGDRKVFISKPLGE